MFSRNVQFAPGGRNNRRRPGRSVREASDDRGFNGSGWPDFTWENGDISALPGRSCSRLTRLITDASDEDVLNPYRSQGIKSQVRKSKRFRHFY